MAEFSERVPPHNIEAEQSVLGACLIDKQALTKIQPLIKPEDFYVDRHGLVWSAIQRAASAGPVDLITVQDQLKQPAPGQPDRTLLELVGGLPYLTSLINTVPTTANADSYAEIVAKKARLRRLQMAAREVAEECYTAEDPDLVAGNLQSAIDKQGRGASKRGLKQIAGRIGPYAELRYQNRNKPNADWIPSRFPLLREKVPYLRREVTLLAMPPNNGKTTVAVAEADFLSKIGYEVAFFELEMGDEQVYDKFIALNARINVKEIRMGLLSEPDWFAYREHGQRLDDRQTLSISTETEEAMTSIRWQCLRRKSERGLDFMILDFLDRVTEERKRDERYDQLVARIAGIGQQIARECNCHVVILAQVDVKVLERPNPIPTKADLSNSKTNLAAWPDNIITGIQPEQAGGDGRIKPSVYGIECTDKRFRNTLLLSVAKGRFSGVGEKVLLYAEMKTGFLGSLARPWPWQKECPEDRVGLWDQKADEEHFKAMQLYRELAVAAEAKDSWF